jgi:hypothetical protein
MPEISYYNGGCIQFRQESYSKRGMMKLNKPELTFDKNGMKR